MVAQYGAPFRSLADRLGLKLLFALTLGPLWNFLSALAGHYGSLIEVPPSLMIVVVTLWVIDLVTGIKKSIQTEGLDSITSQGIRQSMIKLIDWTLFILAADLFASTGKWLGPLDVVVSQLAVYAAIIIAATEVRSIDENTDGDWLRQIKEWLPGAKKVPTFNQKEEKETNR